MFFEEERKRKEKRGRSELSVGSQFEEKNKREKERKDEETSLGFLNLMKEKKRIKENKFGVLVTKRKIKRKE
jgi:hypothetical protein